MGFVAGGTAATTTATQIYYTVINEGGNQSVTYLSTSVIDAGTINTQNLNFVGSGSVGFTNLNVANLTASNTIQAIGGISTTTISSASAYIGTLTIGNASDLGIFNVGGLFTANAGLNVSGAAFTTTGATTTHSNAVSITTGGIQVGGAATLSNGLTVAASGAAITGNTTVAGTFGVTGANLTTLAGGLTVSASGAAITGNTSITTGTFTVNGAQLTTLQGGLSTTTISSSSAYVGSLIVNSLQIGANPSFTSLGDIITTSISNTGVLNQNNLLTVYGANLTTLQGGLSTTTISSSSAYIGALTVGSASDFGTLNVGGLITAAAGVGITTGGLTVGGAITASNGISTTTISSGSITATNFYGNGSGLTGISGGSANLVISNVTGTSLLQTGTTPTITSTASGTYYILTNSGFSNIYIYDYLSSGTFNGYYTVLANQTGTSLTVATTNLNITRSGFLDIPADTTMTLAYSPSNGYAGYIIM